jgi:hypothetical protein
MWSFSGEMAVALPDQLALVAKMNALTSISILASTTFESTEVKGILDTGYA